MGFNNWSCWGWGSGILGNGGFIIMHILVFFVIGLLIYSFFSKKSFCCSNNEKSAFTLLKERFARGEITKEQFQEMKKDVN
ncbi:SHOCT domain-containing protein [Candidatus Margulisiibacteriota bacterium]